MSLIGELIAIESHIMLIVAGFGEEMGFGKIFQMVVWWPKPPR
jgi:hypothetical protein